MVRFHLSPPYLLYIILYIIEKYIGNLKQVIQGNQMSEFEIVLMYIENERMKINEVERSLKFSRKHIEKYIDENKVN